MSVPPTLSPWPAPTLDDAATYNLPAPVDVRAVAPAPRRSVVVLVETARRMTSRSERAEHAALKEEQRIRADLLDLPAGWFLLHSSDLAPLPELDRSANHVAVGPGGVFLIYLAHHVGAKVWVSEHALTIDGKDSDRFGRVRSEARRTSGMLTAAIGSNVTTQAVLVLIGAATMQTLSRSAEVEVRDQHDLRDWLCRQPPRLPADAVAALREHLPSREPTAEHAVTGLSPAVSAQAD